MTNQVIYSRDRLGFNTLKDGKYDYLYEILSTEQRGNTYQFVSVSSTIPTDELSEQQNEYLQRFETILRMYEELRRLKQCYSWSEVRKEALDKINMLKEEHNKQLNEIRQELSNLQQKDTADLKVGGVFPFIFEFEDGLTKNNVFTARRPNIIDGTRINVRRAFHDRKMRKEATKADSSPSQPETSLPSPHGAQTQQTATPPHADGPPASKAD